MISLDAKINCQAYLVKGFHRLRDREHLSAEDINKSLDPNFNRSAVFQTGLGSGASGSFFFFSHDKNFVVKTMTSTEKNLFVNKVGKKYFEYLEKYPFSCLARIYGIYSVKMEGIQEVHIMLMANTLRFEHNDQVRFIFDLKGSYVNRNIKVKPGRYHTKTLKDNNIRKFK